MDFSKPGGGLGDDDPLAKGVEGELNEELRRRRQEAAAAGGGNDGDVDSGDLTGPDDLTGSGGGSGDSSAGDSGWFSDCNLPSCDSPCDGCDVPDCDCGGCDFLLRLGPLRVDLFRVDLFRLSTLLAVAALIVPTRAGGPLAAAIRGYRRWLTRFTPTCPSDPSCSAYALDAVQTLGARRGLRAAAQRIRTCGRP